MNYDPYSLESLVVSRDGEAIRVWNRLTVEQTHDIRRTGIETEYEIYQADGKGEIEPRYITPIMDRELEELGIDHNFEVVSITSDDVTIL